MDARGARVDDIADQARAEGGSELGALRFVVARGQGVEQALGPFDAGEGADAAQPALVGGGHDAGDDGQGHPGAPGPLQEGRVHVGVPEQLRDREGGARGLFDEEALDLLVGGRARRGVARGKGGDGDGERFEGTAEHLTGVGVAAPPLDGTDQMDEFGRRAHAVGGRLPVGLVGGRVTAQCQEGAHPAVEVIVHGGDDVGGGVAHAGEVGDGLDRGVAHEAVDDLAGVVPVLAPGAVGHGHEVGADAEEFGGRLPEGGGQFGTARGHHLEGDEGGLEFVSARAGIDVITRWRVGGSDLRSGGVPPSGRP